MRRRKILSFDDVRRVGLTLPDVEEGTAWGVPALRVKGKVLTCTAMHRSAEPGSIVVMVPFDKRDEMIAGDPDVYYLRDHYVAHPCVLVRLSRIREDALRDLLLMANRYVVAPPRASRLASRAARSKRR
jgi:hypothetical protein